MQKRFGNSACKRPLLMGMVFVLALGTYLLWSYLPPWVRAYAWPCGGTPWPIWFGLLALFAGLRLRGRTRWLVLLSFAFLLINQRAAAVECTRRWDCADNECCHGGKCLSKSDPRCGPPPPPPPPPDQPPVIAGALACEAWGTGGWCTGNETLELNATEPQGQQLLISGEVAGTPFACPPADGAASCAVPLPEGAGTASYTATSATGLTASGKIDWLRDSSAPVIDGTFSGTAGTGGWFMSAVDVSVSASDPLSGLAGLEYNLDGGVYEPFTAPLTLADGVHMLNFRALDMAGNQSELNQNVFVDSLPPEIDMPPAWKLGHTVEFYVQDLQSGIANVRVVVADEHERFPKVSWNEDITGATFNGEINWDGRWKDRSLAIPGEYFAWVKVTDQAGNEGRRYGLVKVPEPVYIYSAPLPVAPAPTATEIPTLGPLVLDAPPVPEVESASEVTTTPRTTIVAFGTSGKSAAQPGASNSNILWGAAAVAAVGAFVAEVARRKQKEADVKQARRAARWEKKDKGQERLTYKQIGKAFQASLDNFKTNLIARGIRPDQADALKNWLRRMVRYHLRT